MVRMENAWPLAVPVFSIPSDTHPSMIVRMRLCEMPVSSAKDRSDTATWPRPTSTTMFRKRTLSGFHEAIRRSFIQSPSSSAFWSLGWSAIARSATIQPSLMAHLP